MQAIFSEKYLSIEGDYLSNLLINNRYNSFVGADVKVPEVQMKSIENDLDSRALSYYLDINTEAVKGGFVAIIPVEGTLSRNMDYGGVSTNWLKTQIAYAAGNANVISIVLKISSPGGAVNGVSEVVAEMNASKKPILSYISYCGCSGAYLIASQGQEVWIDSAKTTAVGSVGVYSVLISQFEMMQNAGIKAKILRFPENKALLHPYEALDENDPMIKAAIDKEMMVVKMMREEMLSMIVSKRPQVAAIDGDVYYGREAIRLGLADKVGSLDAAVARAAFLGLQAKV